MYELVRCAGALSDGSDGRHISSGVRSFVSVIYGHYRLASLLGFRMRDMYTMRWGKGQCIETGSKARGGWELSRTCLSVAVCNLNNILPPLAVLSIGLNAPCVCVCGFEMMFQRGFYCFKLYEHLKLELKRSVR